MRPLTIIVAMTPSGIIGKQGRIPWHYPEDLKRFKALTTGHAIVMGRKTFESIGKPLPNRHNIVITRDVNKEDVDKDGKHLLTWAHSLEDALGIAYEEDDSPFVIGGAEIYKLALPLATRAEMTLVHGQEIEGDAFFPETDHEGSPLSRSTWGPWRIEKAQAGEAWEIEYLTFERRPRTA